VEAFESDAVGALQWPYRLKVTMVRPLRHALCVPLLAVTASVASAQTSPLSAQDLMKLHEAAVARGRQTPLNATVAAVFGIGEGTPARHLVDFRFPFNPRGFASLTFSLETDDIFLVERHPVDPNTTTVVIYRTDASRTLRAAAVGLSNLSDLHLIPNEDAAGGFEAMLNTWADIVRNDNDLHLVR
jgi:hypothetical protein